VLENVNLTLVEDEPSLALSGDNVDKSEMLLGPSDPCGTQYTTFAPKFQVSKTFTGSSFLAHDVFTFGWYPMGRKVMRTSP
jgi:hypothetical protein